MSLLLAATAPHPFVHAEILPSFKLEWFAWEATHIVLVTEGESIDGNVTVVESWKGDLKPGEALNLPELAAFAPLKSREVKQSFAHLSEKADSPEHVTCKSMVLFLRKVDLIPKEHRWPELAKKGDWIGCGSAAMNASTVWIDDQRTFAFIQSINPGPSELVSYRLSERQFKEKLFGILDIQKEIAASKTSPNDKVQVPLKYAFAADYSTRHAALNALAEAGPDGINALFELLNDFKHLNFHANVVETLSKSGSPRIAKEFTIRMDEELAYWKDTAPTLKPGWWNGAGFTHSNDNLTNDARPKDSLENIRSRYSRTLKIILALEHLHPPECKRVITEFRNYWRSLPQLEDRHGLDEMSQACDRVLRALEAR